MTTPSPVPATVLDFDRDNAHAHRYRDCFVEDSRIYKPRSANDWARHAALSALAVKERVMGRTAAALRTPRVQFLVLHHIFADEVAPFRHMLARLARDHEFVGYSEGVRRVQEGDFPRPAVAISFDDGLANGLAAAQVMEEFGATACFFVCPEIVGVRDPRGASDFCIGRLHYPPAPFMTWDELAALRSRGHEVGNHTWGHANLGRIDPTSQRAAFAEQIDRARAAIASRLGACDHFAWPYGAFMNITPAAAAAVFEGGHRSCASAIRGCHRAAAGAAKACLRRDHVLGRWPASHVEWFFARNAVRPAERESAWPEEWPSEWRSE